MTPAVNAAVPIVKVIPPAPVSFLGAAKVVTVASTAFNVRDVLAVAAKSVVVLPPVPAHPIATVAEPEDVTAVVTLTTPPTKIALAGMVVFAVAPGVIVETSPPSVANEYFAQATPKFPPRLNVLLFVVGTVDTFPAVKLDAVPVRLAPDIAGMFASVAVPVTLALPSRLPLVCLQAWPCL